MKIEKWSQEEILKGGYDTVDLGYICESTKIIASFKIYYIEVEDEPETDRIEAFGEYKIYTEEDDDMKEHPPIWGALDIEFEESIEVDEDEKIEYYTKQTWKNFVISNKEIDEIIENL